MRDQDWQQKERRHEFQPDNHTKLVEGCYTTSEIENIFLKSAGMPGYIVVLPIKRTGLRSCFSRPKTAFLVPRVHFHLHMHIGMTSFSNIIEIDEPRNDHYCQRVFV